MLIDHGESVLYGKLDEIQKEFSGHAVLVRTHQELPELKGVEKIERSNSTYKLSLSLDITPQEILQSLVQHGITIDRFEIALPDLDEIFIRVVTQKQTRHE
jgi:ABC-2 type transport system ATP-binding protein